MLFNNANKSIGWLNYNNSILSLPFEVFRCLHSTLNYKTFQNCLFWEYFLSIDQYTFIFKQACHKINKTNKWLGHRAGTYIDFFQCCSLFKTYGNSISEWKMDTWSTVVKFPKAFLSESCCGMKISGNLLTILWVDSYCSSLIERCVYMHMCLYVCECVSGRKGTSTYYIIKINSH